MEVSEYVEHDATGLARLISTGQVSADDVQLAAVRSIEAVNSELNAIVGEPFGEPLATRRRAPLPGSPSSSRTSCCTRKGCRRARGAA